MEATVALRARGRPPQSEAEQDAMRERILDGLMQAFAEQGSHKLRVEHVLEKAGISRPTFYKYFRTLEEPWLLAARRINDDLIGAIRAATVGEGDVVLLALAAVEAYLDWGRRLGPLLQPLYVELYDPHSQVAELRLKTIRGIQHLIVDLITRDGRPVPRAIEAEGFIISVEYLVYRYLLRTARSDEDYAELRQAVLRQLVVSFGTRKDLQNYAMLWPEA